MRDIRLKIKEKDSDENFIVIQDEKYGENVFSTYFIINKVKVDKAALLVFVNFLNSSTLVYKNKWEKEKIEANFFSSHLSFELSEFSHDYILKACVVSPLNMDQIMFNHINDRILGFMNEVMVKVLTRKERDIENAKKEILLQNIFLNTQVNYLRKLFYLNFDSKNVSCAYLTCQGTDFSHIKNISFTNLLNKIKESQRIVIYIGNTEFSRMLKLKSMMKPTEKIFPLRKNELEINTIRELAKISDKLVGITYVYKKPEIDSEKNFLLSLLAKDVLFNTHNGVICSLLKSIDGFNSLLGYDYSYFDNFIKVYMSFAYLNKESLTELDGVINKVKEANLLLNFNSSKARLNDTLLASCYSLSAQADFIALSRLLGLDYSFDKLVNLLSNIEYDDFVSYLSRIHKCAYIGANE